MLPFSAASREPLAVLKIDRHPVDDSAGSQESAVLEKIREGLDPCMKASVPEPLGLISSGGFSGSIETFLPGQWLHARLSRRRLHLSEAIDDLQLATAWITQLHSHFPVGMRRWSERDTARYVDRPIETYDRGLGTTDQESRLFADLRRLAGELQGVPLPIVWQHGDFSNLNTLRNGECLRVVDWEQAARGIPLDDVVHFARLWLYLVRRATREESFVAFLDLFLRHDRCDDAVVAARAAVSRYMRVVGIDPRFLPLLLAVGCIRRAEDRLAGQTILAQRGVDPRAGNRYVTYVELLSKHREPLFELSRAIDRMRDD